MAKKRPRRKGRALKTLIIVLLVLLALGLVLRFVVYEKMIDRSIDMAYRNLMQTEQTAARDENISEIMSDEDYREVRQIIEKHISISEAPRLISYIREGKTASLKQYAIENFTEREIQTMMSIYRKYR